MITQKLKISWQSFEHAETPYQVKLKFTRKSMKNLKNAIDLMANNKFLKQVFIDAPNCKFLDEEDKDVTDDYSYYLKNTAILIYSHGSIYFVTESKHDGGDRIESEELNVKTLFNI